MADKRAPRTRSTSRELGWREWVLLPELSPTPMKAKVDTGAQTSSLHAFDLSIEERDGEQWAAFVIHPKQRSRKKAVRVEHPIAGFRRVRSSTGHSERRPVVRTKARLGGRTFAIDITLTSRDEMGFRMLVGRAAIRRRFVVDPGRSYLHPPPGEA